MRVGFVESVFGGLHLWVDPFFWPLRDNSYAQASCPSCDCDCDSNNIFAVPVGEFNRHLN
ncbi:hypothetical protein RHMOL_Rhmol07G0228000 [Rhododendron molle]|uniref:Uncharacterized protein n=1 Tax=Rhododendron molle TaxID=49168 RepID=A0ACC0N427_RHOML|nr:hypothetical protein RHMOL_Rhmol07G0228000 [Rhododendron molle]